MSSAAEFSNDITMREWIKITTMTRDTEDNAVAIARLTQEGMEYKDRDPEEAISRFHTAYSKARLIDDDSTERTCAFNLGAAYVGIGKAKDGLKYLHKAIPPESESDLSSDGDLYFNMAVAYEKLEEDKNALKYYEKAHDEFRLRGGTNLALEMHCLQKCLTLQQKLRRFSDAAKVYKQMAAVYSAKKEYLNQADCLCKMAMQFQKAKQAEEADNAAMMCINVFNEFNSEGQECFMAGRILNELGLLYTQMQKYHNALQCFERALEYVSQGDGADTQLTVVIKQNLGAAYNFLGEFQRAIRFHEEAIEHYAKLNYRNGQGQCFTNLAFALSQMLPQDLRRAELAFHHALRAAKDTNDINMRWQVLEGLGAVSFNQQNYEGAITYFQDALQCVGDNTVASERIKVKLRLVTEYNMTHQTMIKTGREPATLKSHTDLMMRTTDKSPRFGTIQEGVIVAQEVSTPHEAPMMSRTMQSEESAPPVQQPRRMVPIRKRDSFGPHMQKVARGLTTMSLDSDRPASRGLLVTAEESEQSGSSSGESSEDSEDSESDTIDAARGARNSEAVQEIFAKKKANEVYSKQNNTYKSGPKPAADPDTERYQAMLREREMQEEEESGEEEDSDSEKNTSDASSSGEEESEEETEEEQMKRKVPVAPKSPFESPAPTSEVNTRDLATYLPAQARDHSQNTPLESSNRDSPRNKAKQRQQQDDESSESEEEEDDNPYASIDQTTRSQRAYANDEGNDNKSNGQGEQTGEFRSNWTGRKGRNFFDSEEESKMSCENENQSSDIEDKSESRGAESPQAAQDWPKPAESRAQKEMKLFQEHQRMRQEQADAPPLPARSDEKRSKTCSIM